VEDRKAYRRITLRGLLQRQRKVGPGLCSGTDMAVRIISIVVNWISDATDFVSYLHINLTRHCLHVSWFWKI
jgi:hypothetical protein